MLFTYLKRMFDNKLQYYYLFNFDYKKGRKCLMQFMQMKITYE